MKINQSKSKVGRAIMAFSLLLGIGIVLGSAAQAQSPNDRYAQERGRNWNVTVTMEVLLNCGKQLSTPAMLKASMKVD
jgi:hypothetical protein